MKRTLRVHFLPALATPERLRDVTVVVIDVLRAGTTMVHALAAGAREVIACEEIDEVHGHAEQFAREEIVLGGERGGLKIEGFDLGNSPDEYTRESVGGKTVLLTTTNGTRALARCRPAEQVLIGVPTNLSALCAAVAEAEHLHLLCAGTNDQLSRDDVLTAGAIVDRVCQQAKDPPQLDDAALLAQAAWRDVVAAAAAAGEPLDDRLAREFRNSAGGRNLVEIGYERDLATCADVDRLAVVPELDLRTWRIRLP